MDDIEIALLNCQDAIDANRVNFPVGRSVVVWESDLKVLMEAARRQMKS